MLRISFEDAYGLSLIMASLKGLKGVNKARILRNLSPKARRIGLLILRRYYEHWTL